MAGSVNTLCSGSGNISTQYAGNPAPVYNPPVPFVQRIGDLYIGKMIFIGGIPHPNAKRFTINLQNGDRNIAFHFDVRIHYGGTRNTIVRNTRQNGGWGKEERELAGSYFPFQPDMYFDLIILTGQHCFKVAVNNQNLLEFNHRVQPFSEYNELRITGDLRLTQVRFP